MRDEQDQAEVGARVVHHQWERTGRDGLYRCRNCGEEVANMGGGQPLCVPTYECPAHQSTLPPKPPQQFNRELERLRWLANQALYELDDATASELVAEADRRFPLPGENHGTPATDTSAGRPSDGS